MIHPPIQQRSMEPTMLEIFLNPSSLNTVIFRILVVRLFSWSPKGDSATLGEKREKENEERRRMKERRRDKIILMKQVKSMHHT